MTGQLRERDAVHRHSLHGKAILIGFQNTGPCLCRDREAGSFTGWCMDRTVVMEDQSYEQVCARSPRCAGENRDHAALINLSSM